MGKLTAKNVENLIESSTYENSEGLRLIVKTTGPKNWVQRFSYTTNKER
jgi:hypothetical protein